METAVPGRLAHPERRGGGPWDPHGHDGPQTQESPGRAYAFATFVPYAPHASAHPMCPPSKKEVVHFKRPVPNDQDELGLPPWICQRPMLQNALVVLRSVFGIGLVYLYRTRQTGAWQTSK